MKYTVQLFARARDLAGSALIELELPEAAVIRDLRRELGQQVPTLLEILPHLLISLNEDYAHDDQRIPPEARIACFPAVSGG